MSQLWDDKIACLVKAAKEARDCIDEISEMFGEPDDLPIIVEKLDQALWPFLQDTDQEKGS